MFFKRKAYDKLLEWKHNYSDRYAVLLEGRDVLVSQLLRNILRRMNISHIF